MATIKVTKSELKEYITEAIKGIIAENKFEYAISFDVLVELLDEIGWAITHEFKSSLKSGEQGMCYEISPYKKGYISSDEVKKVVIDNAQYPNGIKFYQYPYRSGCTIFAMSIKAHKDNPNIISTIIEDLKDGVYDSIIELGMENGYSSDDIAHEICKKTPGVEKENYYLLSVVKKLIKGKIGERDENQLELALRYS